MLVFSLFVICAVEDFLVHDLQRLVAFAECQDMSKDLKKVS